MSFFIPLSKKYYTWIIISTFFFWLRFNLPKIGIELFKKTRKAAPKCSCQLGTDAGTCLVALAVPFLSTFLESTSYSVSPVKITWLYEGNLLFDTILCFLIRLNCFGKVQMQLYSQTSFAKTIKIAKYIDMTTYLILNFLSNTHFNPLPTRLLILALNPFDFCRWEKKKK